MSEETVLISELTWREYKRRVDAGVTVIIPVGAIEQHGPHLPLGTDAMLTAEMGKRIASRVGGLVAPLIPYGYKSQPKSGGGNHFPGTTSFDGQTLIAAVRDLIREFARHGVKNIVVLDGHFENQMFLTEAIDLALRDLKAWGIDGVRVLKMAYAEDVSKQTLDLIFPDGFRDFLWSTPQTSRPRSCCICSHILSTRTHCRTTRPMISRNTTSIPRRKAMFALAACSRPLQRLRRNTAISWWLNSKTL